MLLSHMTIYIGAASKISTALGYEGVSVKHNVSEINDEMTIID